MKKNTLLQIIETPTRPLYNDAIIDLILTNTNKAQNSGVLDWNLSDHSPTFINIKKEKVIFQKHHSGVGPIKISLKRISSAYCMNATWTISPGAGLENF